MARIEIKGITYPQLNSHERIRDYATDLLLDARRSATPKVLDRDELREHLCEAIKASPMGLDLMQEAATEAAPFLAVNGELRPGANGFASAILAGDDAGAGCIIRERWEDEAESLADEMLSDAETALSEWAA
jgi:hypothetical protein